MNVSVYFGSALSEQQKLRVCYGMFFTCIEQERKFEELGGLENPMIPKPEKNGLGQPFYPVKDTEIRLKGSIASKEKEVFLRSLLDILTKCMDADNMTIFVDESLKPKLGCIPSLLRYPQKFVKTHEEEYTGVKGLDTAEITLLKSIYYKMNIPTGREIRKRNDRRSVIVMFVKEDLIVKAAMNKAKFLLGETPDSQPVKYSVYIQCQPVDDYLDLVNHGRREFSLGYAGLAVKREENGIPLTLTTLNNADQIRKGVAISLEGPDELYLQTLLKATLDVVSRIINGQNIYLTLVTKDPDFVALFSYPNIVSEYGEEVRTLFHNLKTLFLSLKEVHIVCVNGDDVYGQRCLTLCEELADTANYKHKEAVFDRANKERKADELRKKKKKKKKK